MLPSVEFSLFGWDIHIHFYSFFISLATISGCIGIFWVWNQVLSNRKRSLFYTSLMGVASLVGARFLYVAKNYDKFTTNWSKAFVLEFKFFSLFGVMLFAGVLLWILCRISKISFYGWLDKAVMPLTIALVLSRCGCLMNGCCFGKVTEVPWGLPVEKGSLAYVTLFERNPISMLRNPNIHIHPTQIYEILAILMAFILSSVLARYMNQKANRPGLKSILFGIFLSAGRFIAFWFRDPIKSEDVSQIVGGPILYLVLIVVALIWIQFLKAENLHE